MPPALPGDGYATVLCLSRVAATQRTAPPRAVSGREEAGDASGGLLAVLKWHYYPGRRGIPPIGLERMLRMAFVQQRYSLADEALEDTLAVLRERGPMLNKGTMADASNFAARPFTKNQGKARDTDMHQTRKGCQWTTAKKVHICADVYAGLVHWSTGAIQTDVVVESVMLLA
jgi:hypothetical protein